MKIKAHRTKKFRQKIDKYLLKNDRANTREIYEYLIKSKRAPTMIQLTNILSKTPHIVNIGSQKIDTGIAGYRNAYKVAVWALDEEFLCQE